MARGDLWESLFLPDLAIPENFFEGVDPIINTDDAGQSWSNMQEWADLSFCPEPPTNIDPEDIENETEAAGGVRFCCYGMVSLGSKAIYKLQLTEYYTSFQMSW